MRHFPRHASGPPERSQDANHTHKVPPTETPARIDRIRTSPPLIPSSPTLPGASWRAQRSLSPGDTIGAQRRWKSFPGTRLPGAFTGNTWRTFLLHGQLVDYFQTVAVQAYYLARPVG